MGNFTTEKMQMKEWTKILILLKDEVKRKDRKRTPVYR